MKLGYGFFGKNAIEVARHLVGCYLVRWIDGEKIVCKIVETEAYPGPKDKGCHAYGNKRTRRTEAMFRRGGHAYVYLIYGLHHCFNVVTGRAEVPEAVFIRAVEPMEGWELIRQNRQLKRRKQPKQTKKCSIYKPSKEKNKDVKKDVKLTNGPGKLTQALAIDTSFNGYDLVRGEKLYCLEKQDRELICRTPSQMGDCGQDRIDQQENWKVAAAPRVNIDYAEEFKHKLWRFYLEGNPFVSV